MANKWNNSGRDIGGILRKTNHHHSIVENEARGGDLLVFGYACKVFRDDDKALHIDQGKHLIPWMGDESLRIDRYDVRAALSDLSQYEPPPGGYTNRLDGLTPAEQRAEQLCEEERYYSLYHNEEEEEMYQEEELKRLHQQSSSSYGQVQFDYNNTKGALQSSRVDDQKPEEADEPFVPHPNFFIPPTIALPETTKLHAIVEKTAKFISTQGPQMEILIKAKQSNNPQFEFLNQNNRLNPYYKFVLAAFKNGTYPEQTPPAESEPEPVTKSGSINLEALSQPVFAHPSSIRIPTVKYKPSADCAYTQLISKIKGVPIPLEESEDSNKPLDSIESVPSLYYSSYYAPNNNVVRDAKRQDSEKQQPSQPAPPTPPIIAPSDGVEIKKISSGLMLAQCYASDTEDESESEEHKSAYAPINFTVPPESLQNIIDKTAIYVAKNGKQFEAILCTKQDERFTFLDTTDEFYPYYLHKVTSLNSNYVPSSSSSNGHDKPKIITPVSFSIKSKEDSSVPINPALLQETSDDDDAENKAKSEQQQQNQSSTVVPEKPLIPPTPSPNAAIAAATAARITAAIASAHAAAANAAINSSKSRFDIDSTGAIVNRINAGTAKLETAHQKELKRAEEKVKDRLAQIAREKLGLISKEKQLQLERKKRAMAFLNQIKGSNVPLANPSPTASNNSTPPRNASKTASEDSDVSDASSVHSIPINSSLPMNNDEETIHSTTNGGTPSHRLKSVERRSRSTERKPIVRSTLHNDDHDDDDVICVPDDEEKSDKKEPISKRRGSRSRSKESSSRHRHKKKKSKHHSKKKSKKRSRSRSRSQSLSSSGIREKKRSKRSADDSPSRRKAKKKRRHERIDS